MNAQQRRENILTLLSQSTAPVSGSVLAEKMHVSRQIIVSDIAHLKAQGNAILSTNRGYILNKPKSVERIFKVVHTDDEVGEELMPIVNLGAKVKDVFVWHKIYGQIRAELNIFDKRDALEYMKSLKTGRSSPLKNVTSEYHYHTVIADSEEVLDKVEEALRARGFLVDGD